ncbi:TonB-dependent receptor [Actinobacillus genomosp. 2]|uniref:TonB-dependent receptor domain-containing protein n=1 Tax=Actinobacillus genomosp. 2 TaxID=230709 RepID=UPI002441803C|nr:TonB-dependent receptor [Actinobacillus genomosp. 2]WGE32339.1 TonB-dependent receptor [Actinobacillus genomosp. 2]
MKQINQQILLFGSITLLFHTGSYASAPEQLDTIEVIGVSETNIREKKVGETKISEKRLKKQQVADSKDLVRYETGVTVVENGRFGNSGFAIRGVDENRVGIMIDGLRQAETLSSQGFKELFEGYGNFNNTRNGIEIENTKMATITKGADSIKSGSGALGGSVLFETKDARDYLIDKDYYLSLKKGYQSMNNQDMYSMTAAGRYKGIDALVVHTKRNGHETENFTYKNEDSQLVGKTREKTDPYHIKRESTLVKLAYQPNENHRIGVVYDSSKLASKGQDLSYTLRPTQYSKDERYGERLTNDKSNRKNIQFTYENFVPTSLWDYAKISFSSQKITNNARTDEYCFSAKCKQIANPKQLHFENKDGVNMIVDGNGQAISGKGEAKGWSTESVYYDASGDELSSLDDYKEYRVNNIYIDCSKRDCSKPYRVFLKKDKEYEEKYTFVDRTLKIDTINGKKYGSVVPQTGMKYGWLATEEELFFVLPHSAGYSRNDYNDRDLNTDTRQINLDFDKAFSLWGFEHSVKYGGIYSQAKKNMLNKDGYIGGNIQWWANDFFCGESNNDYPVTYTPRPDQWATTGNCTGEYRNKINGRYSYLLPVKTKNQAFYLGDNIKVTDWLGFDLNYRYDREKQKPEYDDKIPVPKGMIAGIFVPLPGNAYGPNADCGYNTECMSQNLQQNLSHLLQNKSYKHHSYSLGVNLDPTDWLRLQFKYSNGFRAPTSDEIYMTFKHPSFSISPNTRLNKEVAKTKEVAVTWYKDQSFLTFNLFRTDYKDFIDLVFMGEKFVDVGSAIKYPFYQNQNLDYARVQGFEINSRFSLGDFYQALQGFHLGYKLTHQKGRINGHRPMNVIQPTTSVYSFGYAGLDDKYGVDFFLTDVAAKKATDTYNMYWENQSKDSDVLVKGERVKDSYIPWRNKHYTVLDMIAYSKPLKNLTITFGVYNMLNQRYITWDSARSIRPLGTINRIDHNTGAGFRRFYAPGRNFRFTTELTF